MVTLTCAATANGDANKRQSNDTARRNVGIQQLGWNGFSLSLVIPSEEGGTVCMICTFTNVNSFYMDRNITTVRKLGDANTVNSEILYFKAYAGTEGPITNFRQSLRLSAQARFNPNRSESFCVREGISNILAVKVSKSFFTYLFFQSRFLNLLMIACRIPR